MDPFSMAAMIGGGISSFAGNILDPLMNFGLGQISSKKQYKYQRRLMEMQQAWAEKMRSTAHQTEVADLRAAGLNPILSAMNGAGAVTPSTSVPTAPLPDYGDFKFNSSAIDRFQDIKQRDIAIQNSKKQGQLIDSQVARENAETARIMAHVSEGIGTPKQTQNVVLKLLDYAKDKVVSSAKGIRDVENESQRFREGWRNEEKMTKQLERQMLIKQIRRDVDPNFTLD